MSCILNKWLFIWPMPSLHYHNLPFVFLESSKNYFKCEWIFICHHHIDYFLSSDWMLDPFPFTESRDTWSEVLHWNGHTCIKRPHLFCWPLSPPFSKRTQDQGRPCCLLRSHKAHNMNQTHTKQPFLWHRWSLEGEKQHQRVVLVGLIYSLKISG